MANKWISWLSVAVCLVVFTFVQSIPIEIVYTGDACDCPKKLDYQVNVPRRPKPKRYDPSEYGYKVDVPVQRKAKVSYTFDFVVDEPRTPKPQRSPKWDLYAKVDRVAVNKKDCRREHEAPAVDLERRPCRCGQCGITKPLYRYVYRGPPVPCTCGCNAGQQQRVVTPNTLVALLRVASPSSLTQVSNSIDGGGGFATNGHGNRRKRDLQRSLFRPRKSALFRRPARYVKLYHNKMESKKPASFFDLQRFISQTPKKSTAAPPPPILMKRKTKKAYFPVARSRLVKRDIKGEYDLLERDREQLDLTRPEIIQFMPETLLPTFKRGQCQFGGSCQQQQRLLPEQRRHALAAGNDRRAHSPVTEDAGDSDSDEKDRNRYSDEEISQSSDNEIPSTQTKRNAAYYGAPLKPIAQQPVPANEPVTQFEKLQNAGQTEYHAPPIPNQSSSWTAPSEAAAEQNADEAQAQQPHGQQFVRLLSITPDPLAGDALPLRYMGDLNGPAAVGSHATGEYGDSSGPIVGAIQGYPVHHVSDADLDRIISDIVYKHPDFIDATSHYGGALVDPEPLQEEQTKEFLKKLIDGRLSVWFREEEQHPPPPYIISSYGHTPITQTYDRS